MKVYKHILPIIVISQFCCTSLWFAGNGVINELIINFDLQESALGHLTSAVQFGFIIGTLIFAILTIADRFPPSKVFFISALLGATFNLGIIGESNSLWSLIFLRFFTGFFLAGIYPIGMKIAADYYEQKLGKSLGFLVGALVIGTALPHLLKDVIDVNFWRYVLILTSSLAIIGGLLMLIFVPNGPYRKQGKKTNLYTFLSVFRDLEFRSASFGYIGHMWELYAFWAFVPLMLKEHSELHSTILLNIPLWSFIIISVGGVSCILSGYIAQIMGAKRVSFLFLLLSGVCCLVSPILFFYASQEIFIGFLIFWGIVVIADSPLLSSLVAQSAPPEIKGTALTVATCMGFFVSIISIQIITALMKFTDSNTIYTVLAIGPIWGLIALNRGETDHLT